MTNKTLLVEIKNVYGNETIYPVCDDAHVFTQLTGKKTLSRNDIAKIKMLGYEVQVKAQSL